MNDFNENLINKKMDKAIISYQNDLNGIRAGRASINMLDTIKVDVYGNKTSLNQVGNISVPEARLITISVWDANNVPIIEKNETTSLDLCQQWLATERVFVFKISGLVLCSKGTNTLRAVPLALQGTSILIL